MSSFNVSDLNNEDKKLIGRFTYHVFATMRRYVELGGTLTTSKLQEIENDVIEQVTAQWIEESAQSQDSPEGAKQ